MSIFFLALFYSVRPVDPLAADMFEDALEQSAIVRGLVQTLEASNVIVHVKTARQMPPGLSGMTRFVTSRGGYRYLRITISADLPKSQRTAIVAHELQHACEIAASNADDPAGLRTLFLGAGRAEGDFFETRLAMAIERDVRRELRAAPTSARPPKVVRPPE